MYFLYFLILCYTSTLMTPVNSYVVLSANPNDFRAIAKTFVPKDLVNQIRALVLENGHKSYREPSKHDEKVEKSVDYEVISKHDENSYELAPELKAVLAKQLTNGYELKRTPKVAFVEPILRKPHVRQVAAPAATFLTLNDIVQKVKENILEEFIENGHILDNTLADKRQSVSSQAYNNVLNKYATKPKAHVRKPVYKSVPMKVLKEEVQFEATYEDIDDKPYSHQYYTDSYKLKFKPILTKSSANNNDFSFNNANNIVPQKNRYGGTKKVRIVKQVLVPAHSNQGQSVHVSQSNFVQQPSVLDQSNSNMEPHLSLQQGSMAQQPLHQTNATIAQQLALMQQQINQLIKNAKDHGLNKIPALESPHLNIEAIDAHFHILPHQSDKEDGNKTNDSQEDQDKPSGDTLLLEDTTVEPVITETSALDLNAPVVVENEQFVEEEDTAISVEKEKEEEATENKTKEVAARNSDEDGHASADLPIVREVRVVNNARAGSESRVHTQEFGNMNTGEPIVEKTYNFNAPTKETGVPPVNINVPSRSARKVMLF